jgi:transcriptional regulator with XRE-family HTH domain
MDRHTGERIRAARTARGMSQSELADAIGLSNSYLSHIEAGRRPVSRAVRSRIAAALDVDVEQIEDGIPPDRNEQLALKLGFAEMALRNGHHSLALEEFESALETARGLPFDRFVDEALWGRARALEATGDLEGAVEGYESLVVRADLSPAVPRSSVAMALVRAYSECGDLGRAIDVGEQALSSTTGQDGPPPDVGAEVELLSTLAGCYLERGDLTRAQLLIRRALEQAERDGSPRARAAAAWNAAVIAESRRDLRAARVHADRALALYEEIDHARAVALMRVVSAGLLLREAEPQPDRARDLLERAMRDLAEVGTQLDLGYAETERARSHLLCGDPAQAQLVAEAAFAALSGGDRLQRGRVLLVLAQAQRMSGDQPAALHTLQQAAEQLHAAGASRQAALAWRELGEAYAALGHAQEAIDSLRRASDLAGAPYLPVEPAGSRPDSARELALDAAAGQTVGE